MVILALVSYMWTVWLQPMSLLCHMSGSRVCLRRYLSDPRMGMIKAFQQLPGYVVSFWNRVLGSRWRQCHILRSTSSPKLPEVCGMCSCCSPPDKYFGAWLISDGKIGPSWPISLPTKKWVCLCWISQKCSQASASHLFWTILVIQASMLAQTQGLC